MDDYDIINKLKLESISHKDIEFKAKNREKISFKFKPDSKIYLSAVFLSSDNEDDTQEDVTKHYKDGLKLDIDVIFNKKGKYELRLFFKDLSVNNEEIELIYYPIVDTDAKEKKTFFQKKKFGTLSLLKNH